MSFYPIFIEMKGRPVVVIGGGEVALQKVRGLIAVEAAITVVSPQLSPEMAELKQQGHFAHIEREYRPGDLSGYQMAFAATDDGAVNAEVYREAQERGVWLNAVDDPPHCDFIMPSIVRRGPLTVAISTGGLSPAMARKIREDLTDYFSDDYIALLELAGDVRQELRRRQIVVDTETWNRALTPELRELLADGRYDEARQRLLSNLVPAAAPHRLTE